MSVVQLSITSHVYNVVRLVLGHVRVTMFALLILNEDSCSCGSAGVPRGWTWIISVAVRLTTELTISRITFMTLKSSL